MSNLGGVHEDEAEDPDGSLVFSVGLEDLGGMLDLLVVTRERLLDELDDLFSCEIVVVDSCVHDVEMI